MNNDVTSLSDTDLDNAWYASALAGDTAAATYYADEIIRRLSQPSYMVGNLFGSNPFPHYEAGVNFAGAAASSVAQSASNAASSAVSALKWTGGGLLVFAGLAVLVFVVVKTKK